MVICLVVSYIIVLTEFNNGQFPPDVLRDDINNSVMLGESNGMMQYYSALGLKVNNPLSQARLLDVSAQTRWWMYWRGRRR